MAHGKIFQISTKPIERDNYVEHEDFYNNHDSYADYVGYEVKDECRGECIANLLKYDLHEIFDQDGETLVYKGKPALKAFIKKWVDAIHEKAQAITVDNVMQQGSRVALHDVVDCTHKVCTDRFCIKEWSGEFAEPTANLIGFVSGKLRKGQRLYIGSIIDFHY